MKNLLVPFAFALVFICSCRKENANEITKTQQNPGTTEFLGCHGFDVSTIQESEDYITIEGDIVFEKRSLADVINASGEEFNFDHPTEGVEERQYAIGSSALINMTNTTSIKYYIDNSIANLPNIGASMVNEIVNACNNWQNVSNCRLAFTRVYTHSAARISFFADNSSALPLGMQNLKWIPGNYTTGAACFPSLGQIGRFVSIQDGMAQFPAEYTWQRRQNITTHEIGHALGLRHNQGWNEGNGTDDCGTSVVSPIQIAGTPFSDPSSVMVSGLVGIDNTISQNDIIAIQFMYPDAYSVPQIANIVPSTSGKVTVQTTPPSGQSPYKLVVVRRNMAGTLQQATEFLTPGNGTNFTVPCPNGLWTIEVAYLNYGSYGFTSSKYAVLGGTFKLTHKNTSPAKCLDVVNNSGAAGANVQQWNDNGNDAQRWIVALQSDGYYKLTHKNVYPAQCLDVVNNSNTAGANVQQWNDNGNNAQRWAIALQPDGFFKLTHKGTNPAQCLEVVNNSNTAGANVQQWYDNGNDAQRWQLTMY